MTVYVITEVSLDRNGEVAYARLCRVENAGGGPPQLGTSEVMSRSEIVDRIHALDHVYAKRAELQTSVPPPDSVRSRVREDGIEYLESHDARGQTQTLHELPRLAMPDFEPTAEDLAKLREIEGGIAHLPPANRETVEKLRRNGLVDESHGVARLTDLGRWMLRGT